MIVPEMRDWVKTKSVCLSLSVSGNNALRPLSPAICIHMKHLLKPANTSSSPAQVLCQAPAQVFLPVRNNVFFIFKKADVVRAADTSMSRVVITTSTGC